MEEDVVEDISVDVDDGDGKSGDRIILELEADDEKDEDADGGKSGWSSSAMAFASETLKTLGVTTSMNAHAGMDVPDGTIIGKALIVT